MKKMGDTFVKYNETSEDRNRNKMEMNNLGKKQAVLLLVKEFLSSQNRKRKKKKTWLKRVSLIVSIQEILSSGTFFLATAVSLKVQGFALRVHRLLRLTD